MIILGGLIVHECSPTAPTEDTGSPSSVVFGDITGGGAISLLFGTGFQMFFNLPTNNGIIQGNYACEVILKTNSTITPTNYWELYIIVDDILDFYLSKLLIRNNTQTNITTYLNTFKFRNGIHTVQPWLRVTYQGISYYIIGDKVSVTISNLFTVLTNISDPADDWHGIKGDLFNPAANGADGTYLDGIQDITNVKVSAAGGNIRFDLSMPVISTAWSPTYGFDHVCFVIYMDDPSKTGVTDFPKQNSEVPLGMANWDYQVFCQGWGKAVYSSVGADAGTFGSSTGAPDLTVNYVDNIVSIIAFSDTIGNPATLDGWKFYVTTFDYDGISSDYRRVGITNSIPDHQFHSSQALLFQGQDYTNAKILDWIGPVLINY